MGNPVGSETHLKQYKQQRLLGESGLPDLVICVSACHTADPVQYPEPTFLSTIRQGNWRPVCPELEKAPPNTIIKLSHTFV